MLILVAEDDALVACALALQLQAAGHRVLGPAASLEQAEDLARDEHPDFALVDIDLHRKGDGVILARALKTAGVLSLFMTGRPNAARAAADAALGVISKPYDPGDIDQSLAVVQSMIGGGAAPYPPLPPSLELFARSDPPSKPGALNQ
jgi:two-component system, response regulator PdtaR